MARSGIALAFEEARVTAWLLAADVRSHVNSMAIGLNGDLSVAVCAHHRRTDVL
jgi:hypothetical protein